MGAIPPGDMLLTIALGQSKVKLFKWIFAALGVAAGLAALSSMAGSGIVAPASVTFTDVTAQAGIKFVHNSGRAGQKFLP
jgi:hypothetical protein